MSARTRPIGVTASGEPAPCCAPLFSSPLSETDARELASVFAAIADPVRFRVVNLIAIVGEVCSCEFVGPVGKGQPTVSHHTKVLADAGLIVGDRRGRRVRWRAVPGRFETLRVTLRP